MTEISRFWDGNPGIGDGSVAPYDAGTEFAEVMIGVSGSTSSTNKSGVCQGPIGADNPFGISSPAAGTVRILPGEAVVYGTWYKSNANIDLSLATPATAMRTDIIVLRKVWATQTVRMVAITGVEGGGSPVAVNIVGDTWDMVLYSIDVTTAGAATIRDGRVFLGSSLWAQFGSPRHIRTIAPIVTIRPGPALDWHPARYAFQLGNGASIASTNNIGGLWISDNWYLHSSAQNIAPIDAPSAQISMPGNGTIALSTAPKPAAGSGGLLTYHGAFYLDANGVITIAPRAPNLVALVVNGGAIQLGSVAQSSSGMILGPPGWPINVKAISSFQPTPTNAIALGWGDAAWTTVHATNGAIQPSLATVKSNIAPLDPAACVDAVLNTDWVSFTYNPPVYDPSVEEDPEFELEKESDFSREARLNAATKHAEMLVETQYTRQQKGYVLQSADHNTADLFGLSDRASASPSSDLAVVACALQQLIKDFNELKNRPTLSPQAGNGGRRGAK
jgi:hypothetical protein